MSDAYKAPKILLQGERLQISHTYLRADNVNNPHTTKV